MKRSLKIQTTLTFFENNSAVKFASLATCLSKLMLFLRMFGAKGYLTEGQYKKWKGHRHIPWIIHRNDKNHLSKNILWSLRWMFHLCNYWSKVINQIWSIWHSCHNWLNLWKWVLSNLTQHYFKWEKFNVWTWDTKFVISVISIL